ncbi:hypothetical protein [Roseicyclus marinus]|uniref:hypothetical protein n=1 Tax=Roseicyclus marinus TaxID=2161673 RepID=UPI0024102B94|nr:hypothetical protein [Roseicyclus marinus]MDG3040453.1 hypothetical protein [Roseicyclus marinus]
MDRQALKDGKERVRLHLLEPLQNVLRLKRPRGVAEWQHVAGLAELQSRLAYMSEIDLVALREAVASILSRDGAWPSPAVVIGFANTIQRPPPSDSPKVTSYMASAAGARARAEGFHVELYLWLKAHAGVPTGEFQLRELKQTAEANARRFTMLLADRDRGLALSSGDLSWLAWYQSMRERANALIADLTEGRAA